MTFERAIVEFNKIKKGINFIPFVTYAAIVNNKNSKKDFQIEVGLLIKDGIGFEGLETATQKATMLLRKKEKKNHYNSFQNSIDQLFEEKKYLPRLSNGIQQINCTDETLDKGWHDELKGGISIGNIGSAKASGTLGGIFKVSNNSNILYGITNHHVITKPAAKHSLVIQPGRNDTFCRCRKGRVVGKVIFKTYKDYDVAFIKIKPEINSTSGDRNDKERIKGLAKPYIGSKVNLTGRTSKYREGSIISKYAVINLFGLKKENKTFNKVLMATGMSCSGDSGSLLLDKNRKAVGIVIAHDSEADRTFFHDINDILSINGYPIYEKKLPLKFNNFI